MARFSSLPAEVRLKIWEGLVEPRTVHVWPTGPAMNAAHSSGRKKKSNIRYLVSSSPVPVLLQVNQESRTFGSTKQYQKLTLEDVHQQPYVWVNFDLDIIQIEPHFFHLFQLYAHRIRRLQFAAENTDEVFYHWNSHNLLIFSNLIQCFVMAIDGWQAFDETREEQAYSCVPEEHYVIDLERNRIMIYPEVGPFSDLERDGGDDPNAGRPVPTNLAIDLMYSKHRWYPPSEREALGIERA